jgi:tRNA uridine 5-carboxymethylaminomethyl modification enzyme
MRLYEKAKEIGLLSKEKLEYLENAINIVNSEIERLREISVPMVKANELLEKLGSNQKFAKGIKIGELLKVKEVTYDSLKDVTEIGDYPEFIKNQIETIIKYDIFIQRENEQIEKFKRLEEMRIPKDFDFSTVKGISNIARSGLEEIRPLSIGEASRISGVTGNDIALLIGYLK